MQPLNRISSTVGTAKREAQREGQDRDLDVVGEQKGGEAREKFVAAVVEHAAQQRGRRVGVAAAGQARRE